MKEKPSHNEDEYFARQEAEILRTRRQQLEAERTEAERRSHYLKCPKDGYDLGSNVHHGVTVETCPHCGGIWLDAGELEALAGHEDRPGLLGRVVGDVITTFRRRGRSGG